MKAKQTYQDKNFYLALLLSLSLLNFFGAVSFGVFIPFFILLFFYFRQFHKKSYFSKQIHLMVISLVLSMISCYIFHHQGLIQSCYPYSVYFGILSYFMFHELRLSPQKMEKLLLILCLVFSICYIYQYMVWPKPVFVSSAELDRYNETDVRIRMTGMACASLGIFKGLSGLLLNKKNDFAINLYLVMIGFILLFMFGFRSILAMAVLLSFTLYYKIYGLSKRIVIFILFSACVCIFLLHIPMINQVWENMMFRQIETDQTFGNKDYVRVVGLNYYLNEHFSSPIEWFLGSGIPHRVNNSEYAQYYTRLESMGLHYYDWGILGISWMTGVLSLIAMVWWPIRAFFSKVPIQYKYLSCWLMMLLGCGFTSAEFIRPGAFIIQGAVLYLISIVVEPETRN